MSEPLALSAASERLRGKPGRPRLSDEEKARRARQSVRDIAQRLLDVHGAAHYLGDVSPWTVRDLIASGRLPRVRLPLGGDRELRRLLVDVRDLDKLIETSRETA